MMILHFLNVYIFSVWMYIGIVGATLFIFIQLLLVIDFAHRWNRKWYVSKRCMSINIFLFLLNAINNTSF